MTPEEKARAYDEAKARMSKAWNDNRCTIGFMNEIFPELKESEDERIREEIIKYIKGRKITPNHPIADEWIAWLEKQGKSKWTDEDEETMQHCCGAVAAADYYTLEDKEEMANWLVSLKQRMEAKQGTRLPIEEKSPAESLGISPEKYESIVNECIYGEGKSDDKQKLANSAKTCKNDTILDLLQKMPSCITLDGIVYHFVMKKTIAYMAFYEGEGEGSGKGIFGVTSYSPIDLLTEMLEILKKKGLLEGGQHE